MIQVIRKQRSVCRQVSFAKQRTLRPANAPSQLYTFQVGRYSKWHYKSCSINGATCMRYLGPADAMRPSTCHGVIMRQPGVRPHLVVKRLGRYLLLQYVTNSYTSTPQLRVSCSWHFQTEDTSFQCLVAVSELLCLVDIDMHNSMSASMHTWVSIATMASIASFVSARALAHLQSSDYACAFPSYLYLL